MTSRPGVCVGLGLYDLIISFVCVHSLSRIQTHYNIPEDNKKRTSGRITFKADLILSEASYMNWI